MIRTLAALAVVALGTVSLGTRSNPQKPHPIVVHEWGTVTTRMGPGGAQEGRLNRLTTFDPLPAFVHQFEPPSVRNGSALPLIKAAIGDGRQDVTMRLETPVIYFHPVAGDSIPPFDVSVDFRGGILNEFYPNATASANGWNGNRLSDSVVSSLRWRGVTLRDRITPPETPNHVWLAPRSARSQPVTIGGESEQYIFYRGMANHESPVRAQFTGNELRIRGPRPGAWFASPTLALGRIWLVDVRPHGAVAFRESDSLTLVRGDTSAVLARFAGFRDSDYSAGGLDRLRASMQRSLVGRGLYEDEARAMLETWSRAYFTETGLRVFYVAPNEWVNYYLPLRISIPHTLTRVIVGRIDLPGVMP